VKSPRIGPKCVYKNYLKSWSKSKILSAQGIIRAAGPVRFGGAAGIVEFDLQTHRLIDGLFSARPPIALEQQAAHEWVSASIDRCAGTYA
jgi:hypothetical protein